MIAELLLVAEILVLLVMLGGFIVTRYGPQSVHDGVARYYAKHFAHAANRRQDGAANTH